VIFLAIAACFAFSIYVKVKRGRIETENFKLGVAALAEKPKEDTPGIVAAKNTLSQLRIKYKAPDWPLRISLIFTVLMCVMFNDYRTWIMFVAAAITIILFFNSKLNEGQILKDMKCPYCGVGIFKYLDRGVPVYKIREGRCIACKNSID